MYQMDENRVYVKRIMRSETVLGIQLDAEILHSIPGMYEMDENDVFVKSITRSGTVLGIRLEVLKSSIQCQLCIKWMKLVLS